MKKKISIFMSVVMLIICIAQPVGAINVIMNSSLIPFPDQEPVLDEGTTLVPLRTIAEALGLQITWDDPTDTVELKKDTFYVRLVIGSKTAKTSAGVKTLEVAPKIINGRTMVPLRFIAEALGLQVLWNDEYKRVIINGQIDTEALTVEEPTEEASFTQEAAHEDATGVIAEVPSEAASAEASDEVVEEYLYSVVETPSASITIQLPLTYLMEEDPDAEESFAYKSIDGLDAQHKYNWDIVTKYESYSDGEGNGIIVIAQQQEAYTGDEYDTARVLDEFPAAPERPERPEVDMGLVFEEAMRLVIEQICQENGVEEIPDYSNLEEEELALALGFESVDDYRVYLENISLQDYMMQVPEYEEMAVYNELKAVYDEEKALYDEEVAEIKNARSYAVRHFTTLYSQFTDENWGEIFSLQLNDDEEVRYENVELVEIGGKKMVHAVIYAEDPDDEQGVYEYYYFIDGDFVVTLYGGTLFGGEAAMEAAEALSGMSVM